VAWLLAALATAARSSARAAPPTEGSGRRAQTLRIVVAYPVGGVSSDVARDIARALERQAGFVVIVEHRPGAGGVLAMDFVARSPPDGSTLCFSAITPLTLAPLLGPVPYDPARDLAAVFPVMTTPVLVLGTPALKADTLADMLALARRAPGQIRWATSGLGTTGHLVMERVAAGHRVVVTHVPYKGGGQQLTDALGGQFEVLSSNVAQAQLRWVREGRLKALAVTGGARLDALPGVPTMAELGFPEANQVSTFGLFAAGRTPRAVVEQLNAALASAVSDTALQVRLAETSNASLGGSASAFERRIAQERDAHRDWLAWSAKR